MFYMLNFTANRFITSSILLSCLAPPAKPTVSGLPSGGKADNGTTLTLKCSSTSSTVIAYEWYKVGVAAKLSSTDTLTISSLVEADTGEYYCKAIVSPKFSTEGDRNKLTVLGKRKTSQSISLCFQ